MEAKPRPDPSDSRINVALIATNAPATIAGHDTVDFMEVSTEPAAVASGRGDIVSSMPILLTQWCEHIASNRIIGRGTPNNHRSIPRPIVLIPQLSLKRSAILEIRLSTVIAVFNG